MAKSWETRRAYDKISEGEVYIIYRSCDGGQETLYNKKTHAITYRKANVQAR